jgi:hypothetical protein
VLRKLGSGTPVHLVRGDYAAVAGVAGETPVLVTTSDRPFRTKVAVGGIPVELRMDSWLSVDTIRRMGFGHVIAGRRHTMIVERGVSFVTFDAGGRALRTSYLAGIFAPEPRFIVGRHVMVE